MTIEEALELFIRWGKNDYSDRTLDVYVGYIRKFSKFIGGKDISEVSLFDDLIVYAEKLRKQGSADNTVNLTMTALRQLWKFLENATGQKLPFGREVIPIKKGVRVNSHKPIEQKDFNRIVSFFDKHKKGIRDEAILKTLYSTGVRVSELIALNVSDIDLNNQTIVVITRKRKDLVKKRQVPYTLDTQEAIRFWLNIRKEIAKSPALFVNFRGGKRLTTRSIQRIVKDCCKSAGLDNIKITPHSFRHSVGMRSAEAQMYPPFLQDLLGHTSLSSSKVYYNLKNPSLIKEYHERIGDKSLSIVLNRVKAKKR